MPDALADCLIVGAGPAGLMAALYLARFHLKIAVVDAGASRTLQIPCSHNQPGFPDGISGADLLARMRRHVSAYDVTVRIGRVTGLRQQHGQFAGRVDDSEIFARTVLLATGATNRRPEMPDDLHDRALAESEPAEHCACCDRWRTEWQAATSAAVERG